MTVFELDLLTPWIVGIASLVALWLCTGILLALWHDSVVTVGLEPLVLVLTPIAEAAAPAYPRNAKVIDLPVGATFGQPVRSAA